MTDIDDDRIFIFERGRLVSLASRYRRPSNLPAPPQPRQRRPPVLKPPSNSRLSTLACAAVIRHFDCVESLWGLPEVLGRILFDVATTMGLFDLGDARDGGRSPLGRCLLSTDVEQLPPDVAHALSVFAEAFPAVFLDRLDLSGVASPLLPDLMASLTASIGELRLDHCRLDSVDTEVLSAVSALPQLRRLSVRDNGLWDDRVRCLTAGWRFQRRREVKIRELDVRDNKYLSHLCIRFFLDVPSLEEVVVTPSDDLVAEFPLRECCKRRWRLKRMLEMDETKEGSSGWFADIQHDWIQRRHLSRFRTERETSTPCLVLVRERPQEPPDSNKKQRRVFGSKNCSDNADDEAVLAAYSC